MVGFSPISRWREEQSLYSSPRVFGSTAKEVIGAGGTTGAKTMGFFSVQSVSPVAVSFSLAMAAISPGIRVSAGFWVFPSRKKRFPIRSVHLREALNMLESELKVPE